MKSSQKGQGRESGELAERVQPTEVEVTPCDLLALANHYYYGELNIPFMKLPLPAKNVGL